MKGSIALEVGALKGIGPPVRQARLYLRMPLQVGCARISFVEKLANGRDRMTLMGNPSSDSNGGPAFRLVFPTACNPTALESSDACLSA